MLVHRKTIQTILWPLLCAALTVSAKADDEKKLKPIRPQEGVIKLFNGKNLDGLYTWLVKTKHEDPKNVFTVHDGMLHISGDGLGGVITKNKYRDYHLIIEFKWGPKTWGSRAKRTKDSGVLVHCTGPDGNRGPWMASIEAQIIEGGVGDFILIGGKYANGKPVPISLTCEVTKDRDKETVWKKGGERKTFHGGRINWYGRDPDWEDVLGFRGQQDVESPDGQWTRMDVICDGGHITNIVNGVVVNEGFDSFPTAGKILVQTELAEMFVRRWELWPLGEAPKFQGKRKK